MKTIKPILYLQIEVGNRELLAKIHLASKAINAGYKVVIGQKGLLNRLCSKLPSGVYISGGAFSNYISFFKFLKSKGFKIAVLEEEGLVTFAIIPGIDKHPSSSVSFSLEIHVISGLII